MTPSPSIDARRGAILDAVARVTDHIHGAASVREAMPEVLAMLGRATGVSRVYVFEHLPHPVNDAHMRQIFEWCGPGVEPQIDNPALQDLDLVETGFGRWHSELRAGRVIFGDVCDFPESERPLLEAQAIESLLIQPIFAGTYWWGFMGFDACEGKRGWDAVEADTLRIAAHVCGAALALQTREAENRHAYKMDALGRMAGGVAHDFNNLLTVMSVSIDLLRRELGAPLPERARAQLAMLDQVTGQASRLTRQLLTFSRRKEERAPLTEPLETLRDIDALLRQLVGQNVRFEVEVPEHVEPVRIVPTQLEQILLNLVSNACDAMPEGGTLALRLATVDAPDALLSGDRLRPGRYTRISVSDSGHGIPAELHDRIFEPFFTTKDASHGTGLGLATVYGVVSAASGALRLTSAPGQGTELRVYLPVASDDHGATATRA
jgi:signal transduction histidine kinase